MFDFARRFQLAVGDAARRVALKAAAGLVATIGAGFLLASLWSFLAHELGWGSTLASLAIAGGMLLIAVILFAVSSRRRHEMPTGDDVKREVQARVSLAADATVNRVKSEADRVLGMAETKATSLMDQASFRANKLASDAEQTVMGTVRSAAQTVGLTPSNLKSAEDSMRSGAHQVKQAADTNAGSMAKLLGAFAVGVTIATAIQGNRDDDYDDFDPDDYL